jgi:glycosyltransferase involved in cell wall biosynthesis
MKITIVVGAFLPVPPMMGGAVEKVWFGLAQEFARRGHEVVMVSRSMPSMPREEILGGVRHMRVRGFETPRSLVLLKILDLAYSINTLSILPEADVVVTNTFWLPVLLRDSKRGRVYVHVARYPKWQMQFYQQAARLQAPSKAVAQAIAKKSPQLESKIRVIPNPAPPSMTKTEPPPVTEREKIILFVGRIHREKGVHLLAECFAGKTRPFLADWRLMIVGPAEEKFGGGGESYLASLKRSVEGVADRVIFAGPIFDPVALEQNLRTARLFVYPSLADRGESFGLAPLEAMAHRCAVIVSNLECFHDFIRDGETGFIFEHRANSATETLAEKISNVIADETLLARVADAGYRKSAEYSIARIADQFLNDFNSLTRNSDAGRTSR